MIYEEEKQYVCAGEKYSSSDGGETMNWLHYKSQRGRIEVHLFRLK